MNTKIGCKHQHRTHDNRDCRRVEKTMSRTAVWRDEKAEIASLKKTETKGKLKKKICNPERVP